MKIRITRDFVSNAAHLCKPDSKPRQAARNTPQAARNTPQAAHNTPQVDRNTPQVDRNTRQAARNTPQVARNTRQTALAWVISSPVPRQRHQFGC